MPALRLTTYNIHQCIGRDNRCDQARVAKLLQAIQPDILGLQEVGGCPDLEPAFLQLDYLATALKLHPITGVTMTFSNDIPYGNALLTHLPILDFKHVDLSVSGREPRGALEVDLVFEGQPLRVVVTHLGLQRRERAKQVEQLVAWITRDLTYPLIIMGDFNEWWPYSRILRQLHRNFGQLKTPFTFPAPSPFLKLDRIWIYPAQQLTSYLSIDRSSLAKIASDHLPLICDLVIKS